MMELEAIKKEIKESIENVLKDKFSINYKVQLEIPPEGFGDFSFPMFDLLKMLKIKPEDLGNLLKNSLRIENVSEIKISGPYLNFYVNILPLSDSFIKEIFNKGNDALRFPKKNKRIILEHTSANPTGPLHVGRGRNPIIGDTLKRILEKYGYDVETQYFVNDAGRQSAILVYGYENLKIDVSDEKPDHKLVKYYQMASELLEKDPKVSENVEKIMMEVESGSKERIEKNRAILNQVLNGIQQTLKNINVEFDKFFWETDLIINGNVKKVIEMLKNDLKEEEGALYIEINNGKPEKVFLVRKDGTSLYFTRDIAYHLLKIEQGDFLINILGEDHRQHAELLEKVLRKIKGDINIKNVFYSFVSLPEGRMSTRKGRVVYLDDLLDEAKEKAREEILKRREGLERDKLETLSEKIGYGAVRYNILKIQNEKQLVFRWSDALNFEGDSSPFLQYSYARASSILKKDSWNGNFSSNLVKEKSEIALIKQFLLYPEVIEYSAEFLKPYRLAKYAFDLASIFNIFYTECPVLREVEEIKQNRLALVYTFKTIMGDLLETMGIDHPEEI